MEKRELLEAAARAAGYAVSFKDGATPRWKPSAQVKRIFWNPIDEDGDAMRLAIDLRMQIDISIDGCRIYLSTSEKPIAGCSYSEVRDLYAATRLAIVRAAAAIDAQRRET